VDPSSSGELSHTELKKYCCLEKKENKKDAPENVTVKKAAPRWPPTTLFSFLCWCVLVGVLDTILIFTNTLSSLKFHLFITHLRI